MQIKVAVRLGEPCGRLSMMRETSLIQEFVNTRIWQVAHEIVEIALRYDAVIAIEKLKHLRKGNGKGKKPKRANRKIHRIRKVQTSNSICGMAEWNYVIEAPAKTSQRFPKCGLPRKTGVFFNGKRKLFKCRKCYEANPDRTASRNIATLALERGFVSKAICTQPQFSRAGCQPPCPAR